MNIHEHTKRLLFSFFFFTFVCCSYGQTVLFSESFDEADGATTGMSVEGINWSATCPDCAAGDYYEVLGGAFEGNDTNGPATWGTDPISLPAGTEYIILTMNFDATKGGGYAGSGNLETIDECTGTACDPVNATSGGNNNCWDFVFFEIDEGGGDITNDVLLGCAGTPDEGALCQAIDVSGSTQFTLDIIMSMWASAEFMSFDNVTITAYTAAEAAAAGISMEGACPVCEFEFGAPSVSCNTFQGDDMDMVTVTLPYSNAGAGASLNMNGLTNDGDDPTVTDDGNIVFDITEGQTYTIGFTNTICGAMTFTETASIPSDQCPAACDIVIESVTAVCANDGTTDYELCIDFTHANPIGDAEVNIDAQVLSSSLTGLPDNNVSTTGSTQQSCYPGLANNNIGSSIDVSVEDVGSGGGGASTFVIDFDANNTGYTLSSSPQSVGSADYWGVFGDPDISASFTGSDGDYFAAQDDDAAPTGSTITIANIDISCLTAPISFSVDLAEDDDGSNNDWDASDFVHFDYSIDGGATQNLLWIENDGSTFNSAPFIDTDFDGTGDGIEITDTWSTFSANINSTGNLLTITITVSLNAGDEDIAIDNIMIGSCTSGTTCSATNTTATVPDCSCPEDPTAEADGPYAVCAGDVLTFTDASIGGAATTGTWTITNSPGGGDGALTNAGPDADPSDATFSATVTGTYEVTLTTDAPLACVAAMSTATITVETQETATLTYTDDMECTDGSDLAATVTGTMGGTFEGSLGLVIDENTGLIDVSATAPGTYTVTYTSSTNTCRATATDQVTIHPLPSISTSTSNPTTCGGSDGSITISGLTDGIMYQVDYTGAAGTPTSGGTATANASGEITITGLVAGSYTNIAVTDQSTTCVSNTVASVSLNDPDDPDNALAVSDVTACNPAEGDATFTITNAENSIQYELQTTGGASLSPAVIGTGTGTDLDLTIAQDNVPISTTTYQIVATNTTTNCSATLTDQPTLTITDAPDAGISGTANACDNSAEGTTTVDLDDQLTGSPDAGIWSITTDPSGSVAIGTGNVVDFDGLTTGDYVFTYTVTGTGGCSDATATVTVTVEMCADPSFTITNSFAATDPCSCNGDSNNTAGSGTFTETVTVTGESGIMVRLADDASNDISNTNIAGLPVMLTEDGTTGNYTLTFTHNDRGGYDFDLFEFSEDGGSTWMTANDGGGSPIQIDNVCAYPLIEFNGLASTYCSTELPVTLAAQFQAGMTGTFTPNAATSTTFTFDGNAATEIAAGTTSGTYPVVGTYTPNDGTGVGGTIASPATAVNASTCPIMIDMDVTINNVNVDCDLFPWNGQD